jgi:dual-specificity kinase
MMTHLRRSSSLERIEIKSGVAIAERYVIQRLLDEGAFGKVVEVLDTEEKLVKAMKIIAPGLAATDGKIEAKILRDINRMDPDDEYHILRIHDAFNYNWYYCMVFEKLGKNLYKMLELNNFRGFDLKEIKIITIQILESLQFLHSLGITHTDIKPENILLVNDRYRRCYSKVIVMQNRYHPVTLDVKLIDFGGATNENEHHSSLINTSHYRSPEVLLSNLYSELGWDTKSDIWSLGCVIYELYAGRPLFPEVDTCTHLALMEKVLGPLPLRMTRNSAPDVKKYFNNKFQLNWPQSSPSQECVQIVDEAELIHEMIDSKDEELVDFLYFLLKYHPSRRPSASEVLKHPFLRNSVLKDVSNKPYL